MFLKIFVQVLQIFYFMPLAETTIFNYYFDEERDGHGATVKLSEAIGNGKYEGYTSVHTLLELRDAKEPKRGNMMSLINMALRF